MARAPSVGCFFPAAETRGLARAFLSLVSARPFNVHLITLPFVQMFPLRVAANLRRGGAAVARGVAVSIIDTTLIVARMVFMDRRQLNQSPILLAPPNGEPGVPSTSNASESLPPSSRRDLRAFL